MVTRSRPNGAQTSVQVELKPPSSPSSAQPSKLSTHNSPSGCFLAVGSSMLPASESKFTSMCCFTRSSQPTLEQVRAVHEISSTCALVRPRCLWQSHKDECGIRSSSWFPSEFLRLKVGFHVEMWNAMYMEILMEYDDGDVAQVDLMEFGWAGGGQRWTRAAARSCCYLAMQWLVSCYFLLLLNGKVTSDVPIGTCVRVVDSSCASAGACMGASCGMRACVLMLITELNGFQDQNRKEKFISTSLPCICGKSCRLQLHSQFSIDDIHGEQIDFTICFSGKVHVNEWEEGVMCVMDKVHMKLLELELQDPVELTD